MMNLRNFVLICLTVFLLINVNAQQFEKYQYQNGTDTLLYNLLKPAPYLNNIGDNPAAITDTAGYPLIIFLHGSGERGNDNEMQIYHIKALFLDKEIQKKYPAFVVAPQCPKGKRWVETDWKVSKHIMPDTISISLKLTMDLIKDLETKYPIDKNRIYITGLSMGGFGTWDMICRYPDFFAAAIPICGGGDVSRASVLKNMPIWAFHGSDDKVVKVILTRDMIKAIKNAGGIPKYTEYKGVGHDSWKRAYKEKELLEWLFKQSLNHIK